MLVSVLGATEVWRGDDRVDLGTPKRRALLAALALSGGRPVSVDGLVDLIWGDQPPDGVGGTLQVYVSGLRRVLEPDRAPRTPATVLVTVAPGYALHLENGALDAARFDRTVSGVHRRLAGSRQPWSVPGLSGADIGDALAELDAALALWRGVPYVELGEAPGVVAERARLEELRSVALEDRAVLALAAGDHATVAAETEVLTAHHPLRERLWAIRVVALARSGRQADALEALRRVREVLDTELGLEPSQELRDLQTLVLRQDDALAWTPPAGGVTAPTAAPAAPTPEPPAAVAAPPPVVLPALPSWPLVGRRDPLDRLLAGYDDAEAGRPRIASITGEPGIGKSRLVTEVAHRVLDRGATVLLGRCSQDDGAPPLWPWQQVLRGLGADLPVAVSDDEGAQFRTFEAVLDRVLGAARAGPMLLVVDDLHWADEPTLRVLRMLASREVGDARLLVLLTWRTHPEPTDSLADLVEALARGGHGPRLALDGLSTADAAAVVEAVAEVAPSRAEADELAGRTDGNPFFLVEYARLARERGDLTALVAEADPPAAVSDVLVRRLDRLPEATRTLLSWAAVVGRDFDLPVLAEAAAVDEDDVLDRLDPALAAGLVREEGIGHYAFGHALVRDTVYAGWSTTRRARAHAKAAEVLDEYADRTTEAARHWLAAGPSSAGRAWRAASVAAAEVVRTRHAFGTAAELLTAALDLLAQDSESTPRDRYRLLMERIETHRWQADWTSLLADVRAAIAEAERLDDVLLLADAASSTTRGAMWQNPALDGEDAGVVPALRRALEELPSSEQHRRCRVMLALAVEAYFTAPAAEREALVDEALAIARALGDDALLVDTCLTGALAIWRPATIGRRLELAREAEVLAQRLGDERSRAVAAVFTAVALGELGDPVPMRRHAEMAHDEAVRLHLPYPLMVVDATLVTWEAQAGRTDRVRELVESVTEQSRQLRVTQAELGELGAVVAAQVWDGRTDEAAALTGVLDIGYLPTVAATVALLARAGQRDEALAFAAAHHIDLEPDNWFSLINWAFAAEAASVTGDAALAAAAYDRLAPFAGYTAGSGSGPALGPVDAFLALAAHAVGDVELATRHADDATRLCEEWEIPLTAQWLRGERDRRGF